jgi:ABC-type glycerol-3-phosphate transport system substrate-binding protein
MLTRKIETEYANVNLEWDSVDWGEYFTPEMKAKIAAGEIPDMIIGKSQDVYAYRPIGFLTAFDESLYGNIQGFTLDSVTLDGSVYGIPYNICYQGVIFNKNIFWRYGIEIPKTIGDMNNVITRLNEMGVTPFAAHFRESWYVGNITMQFAMNQVFKENPIWGDEFRDGTQSFLNSTGYADCLKMVETIYDNTWKDVLTVDQYECAKRFANEEAAMYLTGTWSMQAINALKPDISIGIFPYPNADGSSKLLFEPNLTFMVNDQSANRDLAIRILDTLLKDSELARDACDFTQSESTIKGVETASLKQLKSSIGSYYQSGNVADVTIGNRQILWRFQYSVALKIYDWLEGKCSFEEILAFADDNRAQSGN